MPSAQAKYAPGKGQASIYDSLPFPSSVRLLRISPGDIDDPLHCNFIVIPHLEDCPPFHALSYCWGPKESSECVKLNGTSVPIYQRRCNRIVQGLICGERRAWIANYRRC